MTERQEQITEYIRAYKAQHGYLPNVREVAEWISASVAVTHKAMSEHPGLERVQIGKSTWRWDIRE